MKKYKFDYSVYVLLTLIAICLLTACGTVFSIINVIGYQSDNIIGKVILYSFLLLFNLAVFFFALLLITNCHYSVLKDFIVLRLGLIKTKIPFSKVESFTLFMKSEKLVLYYKDGKYSVIVIAKKDFDDFMKAVKKSCPNIIFSVEKGEN